MEHISGMRAEEALARLKQGDEVYLNSDTNSGDISRSLRRYTSWNGQHPYAIVLTCSDSRVIPESIFSAGIGELFVIRVAGNIVGTHQLGSIEYAAEHLGCRLVVVLGHTGCGAVAAALAGPLSGFVGTITEEIRQAVGEEKDPVKASCLNVKRSVDQIVQGLGISEEDNRGLQVVGAMYHIDSGVVEFL